jgi:pimeloyl-ACP methyl ester carboxylesterase
MTRSFLRSAFPVTAIVLLVAGCADPEPPAPPPVETPPPAETAAAGTSPGRHVHLTTDGVEMPYAVSGEGSPAIVLVHCWMCDRTFWDAQVPVLDDRYRVIAVDLPGHGEAGTGRETWTVEGYGRDVAGLIEALDLDDVILVGHSMGGPVSLKAAALSNGRVRGIVAVDTLQDAEFDWSDPEVAQVRSAFESDFRGTCTAFLSSMFVEDGVDDVVAKVRRTGCEGPNAAIGQALIRDFANVDGGAWLRAAGVPVRAINAAGPNETKIEVNRKYGDFDAVLVEGVGHYLHMTRPEEFNRHLLATLDELDG